MPHVVDYGSLFAAAFLSATVLPFGSEAVLFGLLVAERSSFWIRSKDLHPLPLNPLIYL
jgi:membrane protein YqaA with SNARE-associated domain